MSELSEQIDDVLILFETIKRSISQKNPEFYERWKAGGFLIDDGIISMYPSLSAFVDEDGDDEDYDEDESEDDIG